MEYSELELFLFDNLYLIDCIRDILLEIPKVFPDCEIDIKLDKECCSKSIEIYIKTKWDYKKANLRLAVFDAIFWIPYIHKTKGYISIHVR